MMLLKQLINTGIETILQMYPEREAREMVFAYLCDTFGITRHTHILEPEYALSDADASAALSAFARMAAGEPLQYVTGKAFFYGRQFHVTPATLIPRPETELLCRLAADASSKPTPRILDLCTGSGCIAWTLALELPGARVTAVDISEDALAVASEQDFAGEISRTGALAPAFIHADVLSPVMSNDVSHVMSSEVETSAPQRFDILVSNPPYIRDSEKSMMRTNVLDHEPHLALFVPDDDPLRFYKVIAAHAKILLSDEGFGIVEINEALSKETAEIFSAAGFVRVWVEKDLYEKDRFVRFSWK